MPDMNRMFSRPNNIALAQEVFDKFSRQKWDELVNLCSPNFRGSMLGGLVSGGNELHASSLLEFLRKMSTEINIEKYEAKNWACADATVYYTLTWTFTHVRTNIRVTTISLVSNTFADGKLQSLRHSVESKDVECLASQTSHLSTAAFTNAVDSALMKTLRSRSCDPVAYLKSELVEKQPAPQFFATVQNSPQAPSISANMGLHMHCTLSNNDESLAVWESKYEIDKERVADILNISAACVYELTHKGFLPPSYYKNEEPVPDDRGAHLTWIRHQFKQEHEATKFWEFLDGLSDIEREEILSKWKSIGVKNHLLFPTSWGTCFSIWSTDEPLDNAHFAKELCLWDSSISSNEFKNCEQSSLRFKESANLHPCHSLAP